MAITSKYILERGIIVAIVAMLLVITLTSFITPSPTKKEIERALNHINASERGVDLANDYLDKGEYNNARASLDESRGHIQESLRTLNNIETENEKELRQIRVIRTYAESQLNAIDARDNLAISLQRLEDVSVHLNQDDFVKARSELEKAESALSEASSNISIADEQMSIIDGSLLPKSIGEGLNGKKADIEFLAVAVKSLQMYTNTLDKMIGMLERIQDLKYLTEINPDKYGVLTMEMPVTYYGDVDGSYLGYQIAPHNVAAAARGSFYTYLETGNESDLTNALFLTEYLISTATDSGEFIVWENPYGWPVYNLTKGWIGSLSQAGSLKVFVLAYQATGDKRYLDKGNKTLNAFIVDVEDGGLRIKREEGGEVYYWYPEYAKTDPPFVLNGFITTLIWLNQYYEVTDNSLAMGLYEEGLKTVEHYLPAYDYGGNWSYYDAIGHKSNEHYHQMHVEQLKWLYDLTGNPTFLEYHDRWSNR